MSGTSSAMGSFRSYTACCAQNKSGDALPVEPVHLGVQDESSFPLTANDVAPLLASASVDEAPELLVRLLQVLDARHETLIRRVENRVHQAILEHLNKVTGTSCKNKMDETSGIRCQNEKPSSHCSPALSERSPIVLPPSSDKPPVTDFRTAEQARGEIDATNGVILNPVAPSESFFLPEVRKAVDATMMEMNAASDAKQEPQVSKDIATTSPSVPSVALDGVSLSEMALEIELEIVEAHGLLASDIDCCGRATASDPYAKVLVVGNDSHREVFRTHTQKKTLDPWWNSFCKFPLLPDEKEVIVEIWDQDVLKQDDLLGRVSLHIMDIQCAGGSVARWFDITSQEDCPHASGRVLLKASSPNFKKGLANHHKYFKMQDEILGLESGLADHHDAPERQEKGGWNGSSRFQAFVNNAFFDIFFCSCIVLNSISMLVELEINGRKLNPSKGLDPPGSQSSATDDSIFLWLNTAFACIFLVELLCRLAAFGKAFLDKVSSWLDIVIVAGSVIEMAGTDTAVNLTFLRLVRLSRLARLLKFLLMASFCNPLRILMKAIYTGFGSLFWSFVLLGMIEVLAALFMTQVLADDIADESRDLELRMFIYEYYGTTSRTTLTMFQITMAPGQWGLLARPLIEEVSPWFAWFFVLYVGGVSFAIIRIITALFLRQTLQVAAGDDILMKNEKVKAQRKYSESVRDLFNKVDTGGTGEVSFEQFQLLMTDSQIMAWLAILELDARNASCIFELVDDGDGHLTLDEFLIGVFKLKGTAQQIDLVLLQRETKTIKNMMERFNNQVSDLSELCGSLSRSSHGPHMSNGAIDTK